MPKEECEFDIVIVGAGLVGLSAIAGLQESGLRILLLEKSLPNVKNDNEKDYRPLSLAYGSQQCLQQWGVWSSLAPTAMPITTLHISEQGRLGRLQFCAEDFHLPALGYVVSFTLLQRVLYEYALSKTNVFFSEIENINNIECDVKNARIEYVAENKSHQVVAKLLIAADGVHSRCRQLLNISVKEYQADDVAFIASFYQDQPHRNMAYQRFTQQGSFALLPLFDPFQYRLVWTMQRERYEKIAQWSDKKCLATIYDAYGGRLGTIARLQREAVFPVQMTIADEIIRPSFILLGNAAHTLYPIAAQGFNLALHDVAALTKILKRAKQQNESIGSLCPLERYIDLRQKNQKKVIAWTTRITNVFHWQFPVLDHVRGMGLLGMDSLSFIKKRIGWNFLHV